MHVDTQNERLSDERLAEVQQWIDRWGSPSDVRLDLLSLLTELQQRRASDVGGLTNGTVDAQWQILLDKDDRTSPGEYPDMALITRDELGEAMLAAQHRREAEAGEPEGWAWEMRTTFTYSGGERVWNWAPQLTDWKPGDWETVRNVRPLYAASPSSPASGVRVKAEPFCYVREWPASFDPQNGGEPASVDFSDVPKPGYEPLFKASALGEHP